MSPKPTIVFVPGAWFRAAAYAKFLDALGAAGYPVVASDYPSINPTIAHPHVDCGTDTSHLRQTVLLPLVEQQHRDVVLIMHSYGGMPGAGAAHGLGSASRTHAGKHGGVLGLIMFSGFIVAGGNSCAGSMGGDIPPWVLKDNPQPGLCWPDNPTQIFAEDVSPEKAREITDQLVPHSTKAFFSPQPSPAFTEPEFESRLGFVLLSQDQAIPKAGQEAMIQYSGQEWIVKEMVAGHNAPFTTKVDEAVSVVEDMVNSFKTNK